MDENLLQIDALAQAELIRSGEITALELVEAAVERMHEINPTVNCVVIDLSERARVAAAALAGEDRAAARLLAGVPILLKDLGQQVAGVRQTDGSRALRHAVADRDSCLAARYRRAGTILLGKTSSPEFGNHSTTEPVLYGPCRNPWNPTRTAGGSSGGAAAAVAAGVVAAAGASDGAGSIRIPASCCGVFGLKPSRGRISSAPYAAGVRFGLAASHVITRSVRDSAAFLDIAAGPTPGDPYWPPAPAQPFLRAVETEPRRLRIALSAQSPLGGPVDPGCARAAEQTAALLAELGHHIEIAAPEFELTAVTEGMLALWAASNASSHAAIVHELGRPLEPSELEPTTWELVEYGQRLGAVDIQHALGQLQTAAWQIAEFFDRYDVWLTPTVAQQPPPLGELNRALGSAQAWWAYDLEFNPWNPIANLTGQPSASLPLHWTSDGLPVGSLITGGYADEVTVLQLASQLERTLGRTSLGSRCAL